MSYNKELFRKELENAEIPYTEENLTDFGTYSDLLTDWNSKINLTAITDEDGIALKHFYDSVMLLKYFEVRENASMIDVGTGAGFPSMPCKILRPDIKLTLLDSLNKRINFLKEVGNSLNFENTEYIHTRAEDGGKNKEYREKYDIATARAVANLTNLAEYCLPFAKIGGYFVALKGPDCDAEINEAKSAIKILGGEIEKIITYELPEGSGRTIVIIKKVSATPGKYPRTSAKIAKEKL